MSGAQAGDWRGVTAVVLAGGLGTRLRPVVGDRPKPVADVGGRPFLERIVDQLEAVGIRRIVLCTGHGAEQVEAALAGRSGPAEILCSREDRPLGTGGALRLALPVAGRGTLLVLNGDSFTDADLDGFLADYRHGGRMPTLLLVEVADARRYGRVECGPEGKVRAFVEKGAGCGAGWINAGLYLVESERLAAIPTGRPVSLEREVFPTWVATGLRGHRSAGRFIDIGTPESYAAATDFFAGPRSSDHEAPRT
ncbi:MAG: nucleotidyltransferase family protein [Planctomycetaceae bacterium]